MTAGAAKRFLFPFYPKWIRGQKVVIMAMKSGQFTAGEAGKGQFL